MSARSSRWLAAAFVSAFAAGAVPLAAIDVVLEYKAPDPSRVSFPGGGTSPPVRATAPAGTWKLPALKSRFPLYAQVKMGDESLLVILDRQSVQSEFYDLMYVDANANRDLTDDEPAVGTLQKHSATSVSTTFRPYSLTVRAGGKSFPFRFAASVSTWDLGKLGDASATAATTEGKVGLYVSSATYFTGTLQLDGNTYTVMLGDQNCDGVFTQTVAPPYGSAWNGTIVTPGDQLCLVEKNESLFNGCGLGRYLAVGTSLFEVSIDQAGRRMSLVPVQGAITVRLPVAVSTLLLASRDPSGAVMGFYCTDSVRVPSGTYTVAAYRTWLTSKAGDRWWLDAAGSAEAAYVTLGPSAATALVFGPPFTPRVTVDEYTRKAIAEGRRTDCPLSFAVLGRGGEMVTYLSLLQLPGNGVEIPLSTKVRSRPVEPTYMILLPSGEIAAKGTFEYG
jgi:hypothetical protein